MLQRILSITANGKLFVVVVDCESFPVRVPLNVVRITEVGKPPEPQCNKQNVVCRFYV